MFFLLYIYLLKLNKNLRSSLSGTFPLTAIESGSEEAGRAQSRKLMMVDSSKEDGVDGG